LSDEALAKADGGFIRLRWINMRNVSLVFQMLGLFRKDQEMKHKIARFGVTVLLFCSLLVGMIVMNGCKKSEPAVPPKTEKEVTAPIEAKKPAVPRAPVQKAEPKVEPNAPATKVQ
jgi:hypothetical protein